MAEFQSLDGDQFPDGENSSEKASKLFAEENSGEPTKSLKGSLTPLKASVVHHNVQERPKVLTKTAQSGRLLPRMSEQNLLDILRMIPPDAFLEIMSNKERFKATVFDEGKSIEMVALLILVLGKLHKVVLKHNLQSLMDQIFASNTVLRDDILDYVKYVVYLEQKGQLHTIPEADRVWESLETFCSFGKRIEKRANIWAEITDALCGILQGKKEESLVKKHSVFLQLKNAMEGGYFYPGSIYACVADLKEEPMPKLPEFQGGKCSDVKEYLNFQMAHTKTHFLTKLYNGLQEFQKLDEEEKSRVVLKNIGGTNIFPAVRIYRKFPFSVPVNDKYLLVDLAPQSRVNRQLPKDVQKEITDEEFMLETESVLFLSTSSAFEDMIVARLTYLPMEVQAQEQHLE
ncbi:uncharacterized protein LOC132258009 [Phlebotomus argentipes]|uniref:uncharacterized protein LOC132258009 n=1 Tax=Phlebotomus argentipes TaxID=94469 RepID=UPI002892A836|nr:uncharacterized protein LOC132258009 [Phlebotomus argentipes]